MVSSKSGLEGIKEIISIKVLRDLGVGDLFNNFGQEIDQGYRAKFR